MKPDTPHPPARILALAAHIGDDPIAWNERADGSITIVFCNKGKHTFDPIPDDNDNDPVQTENFPSPSSPIPTPQEKSPPRRKREINPTDT